MAKMGRPRRFDGPPGRLAADIDPELYRRYRAKVDELGRIQRHCLEEAVRDWLAKYGDASLPK